MKKSWYHPDCVITQDGCFCSYCGVKTNNGMAETPCVIPTAAQSILEDLRFEVSVWNMKAEIICFTEQEGKRKYFRLETDKKTKQKLNQMAEESVWISGGGINRSGIYPLSKALEQFLMRCIKKGKVRISESE